MYKPGPSDTIKVTPTAIIAKNKLEMMNTKKNLKYKYKMTPSQPTNQ